MTQEQTTDQITPILGRPVAPVRQGPAAAPRDGSRHLAAVTAETRRLERSLRVIGPMPREMLARITHADTWREGTFEEAVREGVRAGRLEELPLGWLKVAHL